MALVVRAPDEETARVIATLNGRKEVDVNPDAWKDPRLSRCVELRDDGHNEMIVAGILGGLKCTGPAARLKDSGIVH